ncbi:acyl carrier protein [Paenibacillus sinopodophylli]|uniref:acyl carrier protein n=1 Tax=Paenibacillus sinopodophylli TaxID=1837342 RepID=UPI00110C99D2|nr:acyl carrier protein [Paenibacillus sinopodophylli]
MSIHAASSDTVQYLKKKIAEMTDNPVLEFDADIYAQIRDMGVDSLRMIQLLVHIEQHFDIAFDDDELIIDYFATIDQFAASIARKMASAV